MSPTPPTTKLKPPKTLLLWFGLVLMSVLVFELWRQANPGNVKELTYDQVLKYVENGDITGVELNPNIVGYTLRGEYRETPKNGEPQKSIVFQAEAPQDPKLYEMLQKHQVKMKFNKFEQSPWWLTILVNFGPFLLIALWLYMMARQVQGPGATAFSFGKAKAKLASVSSPKVTFNDVAGVDEAKEELKEVIEFLKDPQKFQKLGGRIPKGVMLVGSPGTGKTLLAKAVAGEAGVPFFSISGSDFVEMFVGVGASRVRDLFEQGKRQAPCIIFIDELDAVGRHRGAGLGGGHDEREQTLNQLLVEMDGFDANVGVVIVAATNRPDVLDPALLRPGRFDRTVVVDNPDVVGREGILKVHTRKIPLATNVDLKVVARATPGYSGADLANVVNEAALLAARRNKKSVEMEEFEEAKDKVMMGPERRSRVISDKEKKATAYHEAGHALIGKLLPGAEPLHKVTIIPRGRALGVTSRLPTEDRYNRTRNEFINDIIILLGGRAAEEIFLKEITTGARNDLEVATDIAYRMICEYGMSDKLGLRTYGKQDRQVFLGRDIMKERNYSDDTAKHIDEEVTRIIHEADLKAHEILMGHQDNLIKLANALLERESLDGEQVEQLLNGSVPPPTPAPAINPV